jgi:predicted outer membrane repeat protein
MNKPTLNSKIINIFLIFLGLVVLLTISSPSSSAADTLNIYVNGTSGNDAWDGTSPIHTDGTIGPKKTVKSGVGAVSAGGMVNIAGGTYKEHDIDLTRNMTIQGGSQKNVIIDAQSLDRIFNVKSGVKVTLKYLRLINGQTPYSGGAIYSQGSLNVYNCTIKNNKIPNQSGGAIYNKQGYLLVNKCDISYNTATIAGAIYTYYGSTIIKDSSLNYNRATNGAGGALVNNKGSLTLSNNKFGNNKATPGFGGVVYNFLGKLKVTDTQFTNNTSPKGGGAVYTQDNVGDMYFTGNTFTNNSAYSGRGGALYHCHGTLIMSGNVFSGNKASINGGAIYIDSTQHPSVSYSKMYMDNTTFTSNQSNNYAGAIYNNGTLTVTSCTFTNNTASTISGGAITNAEGVLKVTKSTFTGNRAPNHYGGGVYNYHGKATVTYCKFTSNSAYKGGAIYNDGGSLTSTNNTFQNNKP